jgi:hypothetical protein
VAPYSAAPLSQAHAFMSRSNEEMPHAELLEALATCPYLVKAAIAEARGGDEAKGASAADLAEIETALSLLRVSGWREGEASGRAPFVRRNLLLLHAHLHRERLRALNLSEGTLAAAFEVVQKGSSLLNMLLTYAMNAGWIKVCTGVTELVALLVNGLWDGDDDECRAHMRQKLAAVGLKPPKLMIRGYAVDAAPGEKVSLKVTISRLHAHTPAEMEAYVAAAAPAVVATSPEDAEGAAGGDGGGADEAEAMGKEGWWLFVESIRGVPGLNAAGMENKQLVHNALVGRQTLSPSLDATSVTSEVEFEAPSTPGEYKVVIHLRSSSMIGVDAKRKVSFTVRSFGGKGGSKGGGTASGASSESVTSSEERNSESMMEMQDTIEDIGAEEEARAEAAAAALLAEEEEEMRKAAAAKASRETAPTTTTKDSQQQQQRSPVPTVPKTKSWADLMEEEEEEVTSTATLPMKSATKAVVAADVALDGKAVAASAAVDEDDGGGWTMVR